MRSISRCTRGRRSSRSSAPQSLRLLAVTVPLAVPRGVPPVAPLV
jgi:hypothetical protein